ncbi:hypothetical protein DFJ77DRAFT_278626 [Powellomyces hirtus]|nr:hypothetical protein DFJ77DRAFT_278626 [Powellomyces hirtus]
MSAILALPSCPNTTYPPAPPSSLRVCICYLSNKALHIPFSPPLPPHPPATPRSTSFIFFLFRYCPPSICYSVLSSCVAAHALCITAPFFYHASCSVGIVPSAGLRTKRTHTTPHLRTLASANGTWLLRLTPLARHLPSPLARVASPAVPHHQTTTSPVKNTPP